MYPMEKRLIDRFTEDFESSLSNEISREESFQKAKEKFEKQCGFTPYRSYSSYKSAKYQDRRKKYLHTR